MSPGAKPIVTSASQAPVAPRIGTGRGVPLNSPTAWGTGVASLPAAPPGLPSPPGLSNSASAVDAPGYSHLQEDFTRISLSPSQEANLYGSVLASPELTDEGYLASWEQVKTDDSAWSGAPTSSAHQEDIVENLWGEYDTPPVKEMDVVVCPVHTGKQCKKGICQAYATELRKKNGKGGAGNGGGKGKQGNGNTQGNGNGNGNGAVFIVVLILSTL